MRSMTTDKIATRKDYVCSAEPYSISGLYQGTVITIVRRLSGKEEAFRNTGCFMWDTKSPVDGVKAVPRSFGTDIPRGGPRIKNPQELRLAQEHIERSTLLTTAHKDLAVADLARIVCK